MLDGFCANVLAFGHSGSGKSYTIFGDSMGPYTHRDDSHLEESAGLVCRVLQSVFHQRCEAIARKATLFTLICSSSRCHFFPSIYLRTTIRTRAGLVNLFGFLQAETIRSAHSRCVCEMRRLP